jgi:hypothetical protein
VKARTLSIYPFAGSVVFSNLPQVCPRTSIYGCYGWKARNLLAPSFMSVREIRRKVGVPDESFFEGLQEGVWRLANSVSERARDAGR